MAWKGRENDHLPALFFFFFFNAEAKGFVVHHKTVLSITSGFPLEFLSWFPPSCLPHVMPSSFPLLSMSLIDFLL